MTIRNTRPSRVLRLSHAILPAILFFLAASAAYAQHTVKPVYSPNATLTTNDCSNPPSSQSVWYVNATGGGNWTGWGQDGNTYYQNGRSLAHPLADVGYSVYVTQPGDLVCVVGGTYNSFSIYNSGSAPQAGTTSGYIKYEAMPGQTVTINATGYDGVLITASYIQVSGFTVTGQSYSLNWNTANSYSSDPADHPDYNTNCIAVTPPSSNADFHPNHINILQNVVGQCPGGGIAIAKADYVTISGNVVYDNCWYSAYGPSGISMLFDYDSNPSSSAPAPDYRMIVTNNDLYNNIEFIAWAQVGKVSDGEGIIVDSNKNKDAVYVQNPVTYPAYSGYTLIANNTITGSGGAAVEVYASGNVDVVNNSTFRNVTETDHQQPPQGYTGPTDGELQLVQVQNVRVLNNVFYAVGNSAPFYEGKAQYSGDNCAGCYTDNNLYFSDRGQPNYYRDSSIPPNNDISSRSGDPGFVSLGYDTSVNPPGYVASEANLQIRSPYTNVLGRGTGWLAPPTDITGATRTISSSYTVTAGAYTYSSPGSN